MSDNEASVFDGPTGAAARKILNAVLARSEAADTIEDMGEPHVVLMLDPETGKVSATGPYPDGISALRAAVAKQDLMNADNDGQPFTAWPTRLWRPA